MGVVAYAASSHARMAWCAGIEGVGVCSFVTDPKSGRKSLVLYEGKRKSKKTGVTSVVKSVAGGKVEVKDAFMAVCRDPLLFLANPPLAIALEAAVRECAEEARTNVVTHEMLKFLAESGRGVPGEPGVTTTGMPTFIFVAAVREAALDDGAPQPDVSDMLGPRHPDPEKNEFDTVTAVPWPLTPEQVAELRGFNQKMLRAIEANEPKLRELLFGAPEKKQQ